MTLDLATIGIEFRTEGLVKGTAALKENERQAGRTADAADRTGVAAKRASDSFSSWAGVLRGLGAVALGKQIIDLADSVTLMDARLKLAVKGLTEFDAAQKQIYRIATQNAVSIGDTTTLYTRLAGSVQRLGGGVNETAAIVEAFSLSLKVSGATTAETSSAITQFGQAMASGKLSGEEFNAINEASPRIMKALADGLGVPVGALKNMAAEGKLTADVVGNSLVKSLEGLRAEGAKIPLTVGAAFTNLQTEALLLVGDFDKLTGGSGSLANMLSRTLGPALRSIFSITVGVQEVFRTIGTAIGGVTAAIVDIVSGGGSITERIQRASSLLGETANDIKGGWQQSADAINKAWDESSRTAALAAADVKKLSAAIGGSEKDNKKAAAAQRAANKELAEQAKLLAELAGLSPDYLKDLSDLEAIRKKGKVTEAQYIALVEQLIAKQPSSIKLAKEQADAIKQVADAEEDGLKVYADYLSELSKGVQTQRDRIAALELEAEAERLAETLNISLARAVELVNVAKLEERRLSERDPAVIKALEDEIAARKRIAELTGNKDAREVNKQAAQDAANEWKRFTDDLERGLTDSLFRAFEAGRGFFSTLWDGIKNLFKTTVLKLAIQGVVGSVLGSVGLSSAAQTVASTAGSGSNLLSTASNAYSLANIGSTFASTAGALGGVAGAEFAANFIGAVGGDAIGALATGLQASGAVAGSAFASAALQAVPYVAAAAVVASALGLFRSKKIVDGGLQGELGGQINDYALQRRGGSLFSGPSYSVLDQGVSAQNDELQKAYSAIRNTVAGMAEQLGIGNDAIKAFTVQLGNDLIHPDTGGFGIKTQGLSQDEILKKIEAALQSANEQLAAFALGTAAFTRDGETASQTLARLVGSLQTVNGTFERLRLTLAQTSIAGADAANQFIELFGGADQFGEVASRYYENFFTEAERIQDLRQAFISQFRQLAQSGAFDGSQNELAALLQNVTRENFRNLLSAQDISTQVGRETLRSLLLLSDSFAQLVPELDATAQAASGAAEATQDLANAQRIAEQRTRLEIEIMRLSGDELSAVSAERRLELSSLDESLRPLQQRIFALQDEREAADLAAEAARAAADNLRELASAGSGIRNFIQQLTGGTAGVASPLDRLNASQSAYQSDLTLAQGGDLEASRRIPGSAQSLVEALKQYNGSSSAGAISQIIDQLQALPATQTYEQQVLEALNGIKTGVDPIDQSVKDLQVGLENLRIKAEFETDALINFVVGSDLPIEFKNLILGDVRDFTVLLKGAVASDLPPEVKKALLEQSSVFTTTVRGILDSTIPADIKALLTDSALTATKAISLTAVLPQLTAEQSRLLLQTNESVTKTITQALSSGSITEEQRRVLFQGNENVFKVVDAFINDSSLTAAQRSFLSAVSGSSNGNLFLSGNVLFDPNNALQSVFNAIQQNTSQALQIATIQTQELARRLDNVINFTGSTAYELTQLNLRSLGQDGGLRIRFDRGDGQVFAKGGVFTNSIVNGPTPFNMGLMGEAGPEAIMPLSRGPGGVLGVQSFGGQVRPQSDPRLLESVDKLTQTVVNMGRMMQAMQARLIELGEAANDQMAEDSRATRLAPKEAVR